MPAVPASVPDCGAPTCLQRLLVLPAYRASVFLPDTHTCLFAVPACSTCVPACGTRLQCSPAMPACRAPGEPAGCDASACLCACLLCLLTVQQLNCLLAAPACCGACWLPCIPAVPRACRIRLRCLLAASACSTSFLWCLPGVHVDIAAICVTALVWTYCCMLVLFHTALLAVLRVLLACCLCLSSCHC